MALRLFARFNDPPPAFLAACLRRPRTAAVAAVAAAVRAFTAAVVYEKEKHAFAPALL